MEGLQLPLNRVPLDFSRPATLDPQDSVAFGDGYRSLVGLVLFIVILAVRPGGLFGRAVA